MLKVRVKPKRTVTGYENTSIPIRMTINDILVNIDINEEVEINLSSSENFVDAPDEPAVIEVENDWGRQDAEIYLNSLRQVDHASETGRSVLVYCREKTDWEVAKKAVFKLSSAARRLRQPRKVQFRGTPDGVKPNRNLRIQNEYSFLQGSYRERKKETVDKILNGTIMNAP